MVQTTEAGEWGEVNDDFPLGWGKDKIMYFLAC